MIHVVFINVGLFLDALLSFAFESLLVAHESFVDEVSLRLSWSLAYSRSDGYCVLAGDCLVDIRTQCQSGVDEWRSTQARSNWRVTIRNSQKHIWFRRWEGKVGLRLRLSYRLALTILIDFCCSLGRLQRLDVVLVLRVVIALTSWLALVSVTSVRVVLQIHTHRPPTK
jgi:hypothetical protein